MGGAEPEAGNGTKLIWVPSTIRSTSRTLAELETDVTAAPAGETAKPADRVKAPRVVKACVLRVMARSSLMN